MFGKKRATLISFLRIERLLSLSSSTFQSVRPEHLCLFWRAHPVILNFLVSHLHRLQKSLLYG